MMMERFATLMWSLWKAWCSWVFDGRLLDVASVAQLQMIELCSATWSLPDALRMLSKELIRRAMEELCQWHVTGTDDCWCHGSATELNLELWMGFFPSKVAHFKKMQEQGDKLAKFASSVVECQVWTWYSFPDFDPNTFCRNGTLITPWIVYYIL
ncbi:hypothetical protein M9H77_18237 [Catharanthus roseus]|uniref:Uncharacterized protein n=1 Tax=Catharanthus roseus TaxID=4058 RepID=A0ACC0B6V6_CATRO|nr:hypothetical protein M9H77_18237 [Catharanthus roseus]